MRRFDHIDGLRGIAAMLVVLVHACAKADPKGAIYDWMLYFDVGRIGVVAFFCISGFLIPFTVESTHSFLVRRASRILPAFWLSIPITMLAIWLSDGRVFNIQTISLNVLMLPRFLGDSSISGVYWTLEIEVLFYALCAALFLFGVIRSATWLLAITTIGLVTFFVLPAMLAKLKWVLDPDHLGFIRLTSLYIGLMALAAVFRLWREARLSSWQTAGLLTLSALFIVVLPVAAMRSVSGADIQLFRATSIGILLFLASFGAKRAFAAFVPLGCVSYSLYLFHTPTIECVMLLFPPLSAWVFVPLATFASVVVASVVYFTTERPGIAFGHAATQKSKPFVRAQQE